MGLWKILIPNTNNISPINYCANPSVERFLDYGTPHGNYTAIGGATVTRQESTGAIQPYSGGWMVKVVSAASSDGVWCPTFYPTVSGLNAFFAFSIWAASSDTITASMYTTGGGAPVATVATITGNNKWQRVSGGANVIPSSSAGLMFTGSGTFYIDALDYSVVVDSSEYIEREYIDGDQPGCVWDEKPHGSLSIRDTQSRDGGTWFDLADYGLHVIQPGGIGMPPVFLNSQQRATGDGGIYSGQVQNPRIISLAATEIGSSRSDLHARRAWLIDAIKNDRVRDGQPFWLEYTGGVRPVRIKAVYNDGLQVAQFLGFSEDIILSMVAFDPVFTAAGDNSALFLTGSSDAATNLLRVNAENRINAGLNSEYTALGGFNDTVRALAYSQDGVLYAGGNFTDTSPASSTSVSAIAIYSKTTNAWVPAESGLNSVVYSLLPLPNNNVLIGGAFTASLGGAALNKIALYSSAGYAAVSGTDFDNNVLALAYEKSTGSYVAGGAFTTASPGAVGYIAKLVGGAWSKVGSGGASSDFNGTVKALAYDIAGNLYAGGNFTSAGTSIVAQYVAKLSSTGGDWLPMGASTSDAGPINAIVCGNDGLVYAGGSFTAIGGVSANNIAVYDGQRWRPLGSGVDAAVTSMTIDESGRLHVAGLFATAGGYDSPDYAIWNGSSWDRPGVWPISNGAYSIAFDRSRKDIMIGFDTLIFIEVSVTNTPYNYGSEKSRPTVHITQTGGDVNIRRIRNITTGDQIFSNYILAAGEIVSFDTNTATVYSSYKGDVTALAGTILAGSDFADFKLLPGRNRIAVFCHYSGTAPTVECYATWPERHISADGTSST